MSGGRSERKVTTECQHGAQFRSFPAEIAHELALNNIHHDVAQPIDRKYRALAWRNGNRFDGTRRLHRYRRDHHP